MIDSFSGVSQGSRTQESNHVCKFLTIFTQLETRTKEFHTCASFSGVARDTVQGVETCVQVSRESHPSGTDGDRRRAVDRLRRYRRQHRWTCPQLRHFFVVRTKESNTCVHVFLREIAWIRARPTTDRDLESQRHEKVHAWPCARLSGSFDFCNSLNMVCRFRNVGFLSVRLCLFVLCIFQKVERRRVPLFEGF